MFLLLKDLSPLITTSMFGVVAKIPINNRASVPEFPQSNDLFFLIKKEPRPFP